MLHWIIEARPSSARDGPEVQIEQQYVRTIDVPADDRGMPLAVSFDEVAQRLVDTPGVYWEPDGSFAWTELGPPRYRLQGQLADGGAHLQHAELRGTPSPLMLDRMLQFTAGDEGQVMIQLVRLGVYIDETALRTLLKTGGQ